MANLLAMVQVAARHDSVTCDFASLTRHVFASSSCGLCGTASIEANGSSPVSGR